MPKRKNSPTTRTSDKSTTRAHTTATPSIDGKQVDELIAALTRLAVAHEQAEKRREKADQRVDKVIGDILPALLGQLGIKSKPDHLRPVS